MLDSVRLSVRARARLLALAAASAILPRVPARGALAQSDDVQPAKLTKPLTLFVGGLDARGAPGEDVNSDVLKLARIDLSALTVRVISIPRDLYVEIPGFGYDKITRAHDFGQKATDGSFKGGAQTIKDTVSANFGVELDGVVLTTFKGFVDIVDAFGGIDVTNPYEVADAEYPTLDYGYTAIDFPAGDIHLSGDEALQFARTRHQDGDDGRVMRQELVIRGLLDRARDPDESAKLSSLIVKHKKSVETDLRRSVQLALALAAPSFTNDDVTFGTINNYIAPGTAPDGAWIYQGDWTQLPGYVEGFLVGTTD